MTAPITTIWPADDHTLAKLAILKAYLVPWLRILGKFHNNLVYYDGFAGPGEYTGGEDGSPIVAAKAALDYVRENPGKKVTLTCVEEDADRSVYLRNRLESLALPEEVRWSVVRGEFASDLEHRLDFLEGEGLALAPTFAFIDPFGFKGVPFDLVRRLLKHRRCEVFVTFMKREMNRFAEQTQDHINDLIGISDAAMRIKSAGDGQAEARMLYAQSLAAVAEHVRYFEMRPQCGPAIYDLFFGSNHPLGHEKMKDAMWGIDDSGEYKFAGGVQTPSLFSATPHVEVARMLLQQFQGQRAWSEKALEWVVNESDFIRKHGRAALTLLEKEGLGGAKVQVEPMKRNGKKRTRGFPDGVGIQFPGFEA